MDEAVGGDMNTGRRLTEPGRQPLNIQRGVVG